MNREFEDLDQEIGSPISPEQEELWLSVKLGGKPANLAYHQAYALTLRGELDAGLLRRSLDALCERHEALRTTIGADGERLHVAPGGRMTFREQDLTGLAPDARQEELSRARKAAVNEELDAAVGPLTRSVLLRVSDREHVLIIVAHHLICDGSSWAVLLNELAALYSAGKRGAEAKLPPATPFSEYARERAREASGPAAESDLAYWREQFRSVPPPLELPLDHARPPERSFEGDRIDVTLPAGLVSDLKTVAARRRASLATLLFAAFQAYLQRITGQSSFTLILPAAGQALSGKQALVGHCVRTLPMRAEVDPALTFSTHLSRVQAAMLDALEHPRISFGRLLKALPLARDPSRIPLSAVAISVDTNPAQLPFEGLELDVEFLPRSYESFEWFVNFNVGAQTIVIETCFNARLFERRSIEQRMTELRALLEDVARGSDQRLDALAIMTEQQRRVVLVENNATDAPLPTQTLCARFLDSARRSPGVTAVTSGGRSLSYAELERASAALAQDLIERGAGPGQFVGVFLNRSVDLLVATLGIMRAGAAYVPLDPDYPHERLSFIASDTKLSSIVTESALAERVPAGPRALLVDQQRPAAWDEVDHSALSAPAYVIYTSGSTGMPKGAVVEHRNASNVLAAMAKRPGLSSSDVMVCVASPCFDMSVPDFFLPISVGAKLVIATRDELVDGRRLGKLMADQGATLMQATPAGWRVLLEAGWQGQRTLRAIAAGEALPNDLALELSKRVAVLWNGYGPTETTVYTTFELVHELPVTIGTPIDNARVYLLDPNRQPVPAGVVGELWVAGAGVSRGYHDRPELTRERFVKDPFANDPSARMYKSGDLARWREDGRLEWLGRNDSQVKVRGYRIELGEIEARLGECAGVRECVVVVREDQPGDQRIVGYVRTEAGSELVEASIRDQLRARLPSYMVPQHVVALAVLPLNPNGKIDRKALPPPDGASETGYRAPETELEISVAAHFAELLGAQRAGLDDDFFALGGHSLLALRLIARLLALSGVDVPVRVVFSNPTVKALVDYIEAAKVLQRGSGVRTHEEGVEREERLL